MNAEKVPKKELKTGSRNASWFLIGQGRNSTDMVKIDYPGEGELITSHDYAFRISTAIPAVNVDVSIGGGNWKACRESLGLWWFDWKKFKTGSYALHARLHAMDGSKYTSSLRRFIVKLNNRSLQQ